MKLILIEHAQSIANEQHITQGHMNSQLSELGKEQAKKIALKLKSENINLAYSSDLDRAKNTAKEILKFHPGVELVCVKELREQFKAGYEGKPRNMKYEKMEGLGIPYYKFDFEGGETLIDVQKRVVKVYHEMIEKHIGKRVLMVAHGGPISTLLLHLFNESLENNRKYTPKNAAITVIKVDNSGKHEVNLLNSLEHLN